MHSLQTVALLVLLALAASGCAAKGDASGPASNDITPTYFLD
jgi:hypothetical protein